MYSFYNKILNILLIIYTIYINYDNFIIVFYYKIKLFKYIISLYYIIR